MSDLNDRDARTLWHPATHFGDLERLPPIPIEGGEGSYLLTTDGRRILDGISSWWTSLHGHCHPAIVEAVRAQVGRLDHVMFAGFTHAPAVELAEALLELAPSGYGKVFYSDCGSASVEIAMKLSFQRRLQTGEPQRRRFAALRNSYHGETLGALSVSAHGDYRSMYEPLLVDVLHLPAPGFPDHQHAWLDTDTGANAPETLAALELLEIHADELTALVLEPLIQCAGKMRMTGTGYHRRICEHAQALGIHVIADEIAVAFGRTGRFLAGDWTRIQPDLVCLSKGLSGGILPLAATLVREGFEDAFTGSPARSFLHSHTFTGNPIACAAGLASLRLLQEQTWPRLDARIEALASRAAEVAAAAASVTHWRQAGMIVAFDLAPAPGRDAPADGRISLALREAALARGVLLRPLHDTLYWMPPLNVGDAELDELRDVTATVLQEVLG